jgi:hypothetical protein
MARQRKEPTATPIATDVQLLLDEASVLRKESYRILLLANSKENEANNILLSRAAVLLGENKEELVTDRTWGCPGPLGICVYNDCDDSCHDNCLFCHEPVERK